MVTPGRTTVLPLTFAREIGMPQRRCQRAIHSAVFCSWAERWVSHVPRLYSSVPICSMLRLTELKATSVHALRPSLT